MAVINVNTSNTFEEWRVKTNEVATLVGDDSGLSSRFTATDIISALNEIKVNSEFDNQIDIKDQIGDGTVILAGESAIMKLSAGAQDVITLNQTGNATVAADFNAVGSVTAGTTLSVVSNAVIGGTLTSQGLLTANADIDCNGLINVSGSLTVDGNTQLGNQTTDTVGISGIATIGNGLTVNGAVTTINQGLTVSGAAQFNNAFIMGDTLTVASTLTANGNTVLGNANSDTISFNGRSNTSITPSANNTHTLGESSLKWSTVHATTFSGTATTANYADLAELYLSDFAYEAGTVVRVGGEFEITATDGNHNHSVLGVISAYPAYLMNNQLENGIPVALKGRVPVKVGGTVKKGDRLVGAPEGHGVVDNESPHGFAVALEEFKATKKNPTGIVEAVIL
tara:strand:+ start:504 stop:1694 length:1191 start_codon:yes stop_codon:yes gene_type:complete